MKLVIVDTEIQINRESKRNMRVKEKWKDEINDHLTNLWIVEKTVKY